VAEEEPELPRRECAERFLQFDSRITALEEAVHRIGDSTRRNAASIDDLRSGHHSHDVLIRSALAIVKGLQKSVERLDRNVATNHESFEKQLRTLEAELRGMMLATQEQIGERIKDVSGVLEQLRKTLRSVEVARARDEGSISRQAIALWGVSALAGLGWLAAVFRPSIAALVQAMLGQL
jgi:uncharacterized protein YukE